MSQHLRLYFRPFLWKTKRVKFIQDSSGDWPDDFQISFDFVEIRDFQHFDYSLELLLLSQWLKWLIWKYFITANANENTSHNFLKCEKAFHYNSLLICLFD